MRQKQAFKGTIITFILFLLLTLTSATLVLNDSLIQQYQIVKAIKSINYLFWKQGSDLRYYFNLATVNESLSKDNISLKRELESYKNIVQQSDTLLNYISKDSLMSFNYIPATVIKNSTNKHNNFIVLNKGLKDGVKNDMGVVTERGVIGIIYSTGKYSSIAISLLSINHSISAKVAKSNTFGTIKWRGGNINKITLKEIPFHINLIQGDTICTSGFSSIFPSNIPIGTINSHKVIDGINIEAELDLLEDFSSLHFVNIIDNYNRIEIDSLQNIVNKI